MADCITEVFKTYQQPSLNGVPFYATDMNDQFGRRGPNHEYPDRDIPAAEDLGRKQRKYSVSGWVGGKDHVSQAKALQKAAEKVSPATLVHPIFGSLKVKIETLTLKHNVETEAGRTDIQIEAVEFGGLAFPGAIGSLAGGLLGGAIGGLLGGALGGQITGPLNSIVGNVMNGAIGGLVGGALNGASVLGSLSGVLNSTVFGLQNGGLSGILGAGPLGSFPLGALAGGDVFSTITGGLTGEIANAFGSSFSFEGLADGALAQVLDGGIVSAVSMLRDEVISTINWVDSTPDILAVLDSAIASPETYVRSIDTLVSVTMLSLQVNAVSQDRAVESFERLMDFGRGTIEATGPQADIVASNINLITSAVRANAAAYAAFAAAQSVSQGRTEAFVGQVNSPITIRVPQQRFRTSSDALNLLSRVDRVLSQEINLAGQSGQTRYVTVLRDVQAAATQELQRVAYNLPTRVVVDLCFPTPSLVAAHRATGDARRVLEIESGNVGRSRWFMRSRIEVRGLAS
jgi:hypothetical protein